MGFLLKRNGIWQLRYSVAGKSRQESTHSRNKRLAEKLLALREAQILEQRFQLPTATPPRFEDWADVFLFKIEHPNTRKRYTSSHET